MFGVLTHLVLWLRSRVYWEQRAAQLPVSDGWRVGRTDMRSYLASDGRYVHYAYPPDNGVRVAFRGTPTSALRKAVLYAEKRNAQQVKCPPALLPGGIDESGNSPSFFSVLPHSCVVAIDWRWRLRSGWRRMLGLNARVTSFDRGSKDETAWTTVEFDRTTGEMTIVACGKIRNTNTSGSRASNCTMSKSGA